MYGLKFHYILCFRNGTFDIYVYGLFRLPVHLFYCAHNSPDRNTQVNMHFYDIHIFILVLIGNYVR